MLDLLILALAVTRLTLLITTDMITQPLRDRIWRKRPPSTSRIGYLVTCNWCSSIYASTAVMSMYKILEKPTMFVCTILALSTVAGFVANRVG